MIRRLSIPYYLFMLLLASIWVVYSQQGDMSNDGALYIKQAYFFSSGDFASAVKVYNWPFFSYLVAQVHLVSGLSLINAAQALNIFLFLVACLYFFKILRLISDDKNVLFSGFIVIITSIPLMDDYLSMMLRDNGAWAGFVAGAYYFLKWHQDSRVLNSLLWQLCFLVATLFRPEAFVSVLMLPLASFYIDRSSPRKFLNLILNYSVVLSTGLLAALFLFHKHGGEGFSSLDLARLNELYERPVKFLQNLATPLPLEVHHPYLIRLVNHHQLALKYGFLTYAIVYSWLSGLKVLHAATAFTAAWKKLLSPQYRAPFLSIFALSLLVTALYGFSAYETSGRYWMMNWWTVYLLSALGLNDWFIKLKANHLKKRFWLRLILWGVILGYVLTTLIDTSPRHPERYAAISWIKSQKIDPREVYSNDPRAPSMLLAHYDAVPISLDEAIAKRYRYLLINCSGNGASRLAIANYHMVASFPNEKNPKLAIYELD